MANYPGNPVARALLGDPSVGDVRIIPPGSGALGLPSVGEALAANPEALAKIAGKLGVTPEEFRNGEYVLFGISNGVQGGVTMAAGTQTLFRGAPATPLLPLQIVIPSTIAPGLFVVQAKIGAVSVIDGDPCPAESIDEVSLANKISWPTVQTSQNVDITLLNASGAPKTNVALTVLGWRVRP